VKTTPGDEGKWFAAAKEVGLYNAALALASQTPCDPKTFTRAARDHAEDQPAFAIGAGLLALQWLVQGYGYEITGADVRAAFSNTMKAADKAGVTYVGYFARPPHDRRESCLGQVLKSPAKTARHAPCSLSYRRDSARSSAAS
jgi:hypothetical protein